MSSSRPCIVAPKTASSVPYDEDEVSSDYDEDAPSDYEDDASSDYDVPSDSDDTPIKKPSPKTDQAFNTECPICLDEMILPYKLSCGHAIHYLCIKEAYVKHNRSCPLCRHPISADIYDKAVLCEKVDLAHYTWYYGDKSKAGFWAFSDEHQPILEDAYKKFLLDATKNMCQLTILGREYDIDFATMTQRPKGTRNVRRIRRGADKDRDFVKGVSGMRFSD